MKEEAGHKKVCVIIPARGESERLPECLDAALALDYPDLEIIVVDDGLEESAFQILERFKGQIKILKSGYRGPSYARNLAAGNTDAEFIAFTDSDCIVDKDWLKELSRGFREYPQAVACGGIQRVPQEATAFEKKAYLFMRRCGIITDYARTAKGEDVLEVGHNPSCNVMYKRQVYLREGGFLDGLWPGEDVEFDYRLKKQGYALFFNPRAIVYHHKPDTPRKFIGMMFRYGFAQGLLVRRYGFFRRAHAAGIIFAFILLLLLSSAFLNRALFLFYALAGVILVWFYRSNFNLPAFFIWGALVWEVGFIKGIFSKRGIKGCS